MNQCRENSSASLQDQDPVHRIVENMIQAGIETNIIRGRDIRHDKPYWQIQANVAATKSVLKAIYAHFLNYYNHCYTCEQEIILNVLSNILKPQASA